MDEMNHTLHDWQEDNAATLGVEVLLEPESILISEPDCAERFGRRVWVEFEDGVLRVHCYDGYREEPFNVEIHEDKITTHDGASQALEDQGNE
jgi:hypothetical protein